MFDSCKIKKLTIIRAITLCEHLPIKLKRTQILIMKTLPEAYLETDWID